MSKQFKALGGWRDHLALNRSPETLAFYLGRLGALALSLVVCSWAPAFLALDDGASAFSSAIASEGGLISALARLLLIFLCGFYFLNSLRVMATEFWNPGQAQRWLIYSSLVLSLGLALLFGGWRS